MRRRLFSMANKILMAFANEECIKQAVIDISRKDGKAIAVVAPAPNTKVGQTIEMTVKFLLDSLRVKRDTQIAAAKRSRESKQDA